MTGVSFVIVISLAPATAAQPHRRAARLERIARRLSRRRRGRRGVTDARDHLLSLGQVPTLDLGTLPIGHSRHHANRVCLALRVDRPDHRDAGPSRGGARSLTRGASAASLLSALGRTLLLPLRPL